MTLIESDPPQKTERKTHKKKMKRGASGELDGFLQPAEKAAKDGDVEPALVGADPLVVFLRELSPEDANEWLAALRGRRVRSLGDLKGLARDAGWEVFVQELRDSRELVLASKLNVWKEGLGIKESFGDNSPGKQWRFCFFPLSLFWALALPLLDVVTLGVKEGSVCVSSLDASWSRSGILEL